MAILQPVSQTPQGSSNDVEMDDFEIDLNMIGTPMMQDNLDIDEDNHELDADLPDAQSYRNSVPPSPQSVAMDNDDVAFMASEDLVEDITYLPETEHTETQTSQQNQDISLDPQSVIPDIAIDNPTNHMNPTNDDHDVVVDDQTIPGPATEEHRPRIEELDSDTQSKEQELDHGSYAATENVNEETYPNLEFTANEDSEGVDVAQGHEYTEHEGLAEDENHPEDEQAPPSSHLDKQGNYDDDTAAAQPEINLDEHDSGLPPTDSSGNAATSHSHTPFKSENATLHENQEALDDSKSESHANNIDPRPSVNGEKRDASSLHPVLVSWDDQKDWLFQPRPDEDYQGFYLQNPDLAFQSYPGLFQALRRALDDAVSSEEEIQLEVPVFDVVICEDSCECDSSLADFIDVYVSLEKNDGNDSPEPLEVYLTKRVRFSQQLLKLKDAATRSLGRSQCQFLQATANTDSSEYTNDNNEQQSRQSPVEAADVQGEEESRTQGAESQGSSDHQDDTQGQDSFNEEEAQPINGEPSYEEDWQAHEYGGVDNPGADGDYHDVGSVADHNSEQPLDQHDETAGQNDNQVDNPRTEEPVTGVTDPESYVEVDSNLAGNGAEPIESVDEFGGASLLPPPDLDARVNEAFPDTALDVAPSELDDQFDLSGYGHEFDQDNQDFDGNSAANPEHVPTSLKETVDDQTQVPGTGAPTSNDQKPDEDGDDAYALPDDDLIDYDDDEEDERDPEPVAKSEPSSTASTAMIQSEDPQQAHPEPAQPENEVGQQSTPNKRSRETSEDVQSNIPEPKRRKSG